MDMDMDMDVSVGLELHCVFSSRENERTKNENMKFQVIFRMEWKKMSIPIQIKSKYGAGTAGTLTRPQ